MCVRAVIDRFSLALMGMLCNRSSARARSRVSVSSAVAFFSPSLVTLLICFVNATLWLSIFGDPIVM